MADETAHIQSLIQGLKKTDPRVFQALDALTKQLQKVYIQINPLTAEFIASAEAEAGLSAPSMFDFSFTRLTVRFTWSEVSGAAQYEIREGTDWDTATLRFRTSSLQGDIDPLIYGTYTFLIKSLTSGGTYSADTTSVVVTVPQITAVTLSFQIIDNNILLYWSEPTSSFEISFYEVFKDNVSLGILDGTFFTRFETAAGTYTFRVIATDVAGNESAFAEFPVTLNAPPDFELQDQRVSTFTGTKTNVKSHNDRLLCNIDLTKTYQDHFDDNSWASPQEQIDAGYPYWLQPAETTGQYEEKVDYGTILSNNIVTVAYNQRQITGTTVVLIELAVSDDDITYTAFTAGAVQFFTSFRYVKYRLTFTGSDDHALLEIFNLTFNLDVKREQDGGIGTADSTDVSGTPVTFNKTFRDIDSINVTPVSTVEIKAVYDFTDIPNPTTFYVYLFDSAGVRVDGDFRWIARGIV
jgi:hypothetical protein